ncbi:AAA family ATPase [Herbidospora sp. NEAU-GS84]|uniref:DNA 5'-3' helicase n=1 Tax=Herbidospora solisilvae TaxID=2696284 RepID=A0A7C9J270_9ACTN|nr:replicative DNA helicase [Herbidospora solisilvae]NAS22466.1 AAA family ATPase [Herbidospora solisilvae]
MTTIELEHWAPTVEVTAAEMAIAGAAIQWRHLAEQAADLVRPEDFYTNAGVVYGAAVRLAEDGKPVDPAAVLRQLAATGDLARVGGVYVASLIGHACGAGSIGYHAGTIAVDAMRRRLNVASEQIRNLTVPGQFDPSHVDHARKLLEEATRAHIGGATAPTVGELLDDVLDGLERGTDQADRVLTGYADLDSMVTIRPGQLIIVAARPGVGKSVMGIDILRKLCVRRRQPGLYVSLEMSHADVVHRLLAAEARVSLNRFQNRTLEDDDWARIGQVRDRILDAPLVIDDAPEAGLSHIRSRLRGMQRTTGCDLVVVDYLQLMKPGSGGRKYESRQLEVAEFARGLKLIAREFNVPLIAAAQLNRGPESRADKRPAMSDLRESGAIEADADIVMLLHRPDMYEPEGERAGEIDVIVDKQRQGPRGTVPLGFQGHYGRITDLTKRWTPTPAGAR